MRAETEIEGGGMEGSKERENSIVIKIIIGNNKETKKHL